MRVLLVEDNDDHALFVREALTGHTVIHVSRLQDALVLNDIGKYDVALTDLTLPDSQGVGVVRRLRLAATEVPVIVLTASIDDRLVKAALEHGAQDYIVKDELFRDRSLAVSILNRTMRHATLRHEGMRENERLLDDVIANKDLLERKNSRLRALCDTAQRFVENVSHDFRTPLTVIKEFSSLMRDGIVGEVTAEQQRMLRIVEDRADDLNTMVDDLLDVSKLEAGLLNMWRRKASLAAIADHVIPGLERKAEVKGVQLVAKIDAQLPEIFCDEEKVGRVLVNLIVNAIKFCDKNGRVELWARADQTLREVVVGVTDDGPGISPETLETIFDRFKHGTSGDLKEVKGFGLGLSIARELTELNFGRLDVKSVVGKGSTFTFTIPYGTVEEVFSRYVKRVRALEGASPVCSLLIIRTTAPPSERDGSDLDAFLSHSVRRDDLALRVGDGRWLVTLLASPIEVEEFIARLKRDLIALNRNMPNGRLPEIEFEQHGGMLLSDSLSNLTSWAQPLLAAKATSRLAPREASYA